MYFKYENYRTLLFNLFILQMPIAQLMQLTILEFFQLIFANLFIVIVSNYFKRNKSLNLIINLFIFTALDSNTAIYTVASCGTDHYIKIWRIFFRKNGDLSSINKSKLVPTSPQVTFSVQLYNKYIKMATRLIFK